MSSIRANPVYQAMAAVCDEYGLAHEVEITGKHPKLVIVLAGQRRKFTFPCTPSDVRGPINNAAHLRRTIELATSVGVAPADSVMVLGKAVDRVEYQGQRVVSLKQIDAVHERPEGTAGRQFRQNRSRFNAGRDFFEIDQPDEIRRLGFSRPQGGTPDKVLLFTERGYGKIVKGWNDDLAWSLHDAMQDAYFLVKAVAAAEAPGALSEADWRRIGGIIKSVVIKQTEDVRAGNELFLEELSRMGRELDAVRALPVVPSFDFAGTVTSRDIMDLAGIPRDGRVRGTSGGIVTRAMKNYCLAHGYPARQTPEDIDPDKRWRFPRQAAMEWLNGPSLGNEVIRNHIAKETAKKNRKEQRQFAFVPRRAQLEAAE